MKDFKIKKVELRLFTDIFFIIATIYLIYYYRYNRFVFGLMCFCLGSLLYWFSTETLLNLIAYKLKFKNAKNKKNR